MAGDPARYFITTSIPYVNAAPHIGHALEFVSMSRISLPLAPKQHCLCAHKRTWQTIVT